MSTGTDPWTLADGRDVLPEALNIRVPFGDLPNQVLPLAWAEQFLRAVYRDHPGVFRAILPTLYGLPAEDPKRRRGQP